MEKPFIVEQKTFKDDRGVFCATPIQMTRNKALDKFWVQVNTSISEEKHTLRGVHYQEEPFEQAKYLKIVKGKILNLLICIDKLRPDFGEVTVFEVDDNQAVMIPRGYGNCVFTLEPGTIIQYFVDNNYSPEKERSISYKTIPEFKEIIGRYTNNPSISDKDLNGISWDEI